MAEPLFVRYKKRLSRLADGLLHRGLAGRSGLLGDLFDGLCLLRSGLRRSRLARTLLTHDRVLEGLRREELEDALRCYFDGLAGRGIAAHAGSSIANLELTEAWNLHGLARDDRALDVREDGIDDGDRLAALHVFALDERADQIYFVQEFFLSSRRTSASGMSRIEYHLRPKLKSTSMKSSLSILLMT